MIGDVNGNRFRTSLLMLGIAPLSTLFTVGKNSGIHYFLTHNPLFFTVPAQ
jgi:hypothetical protein